MEFDQLRYFISVANTLNFTQAAKINFITQPAISRRITELEKELGAQLFVRDSHKVQITKAGEEFYQYATSVLDMTTAATQRIQNVVAGTGGVVRIMATHDCEVLLSKILSGFHEKYPKIQIDLNISTGSPMLMSIGRNEYDFYFSFESLLKNCANIEYVNTVRDRFQLFVPTKYAHLVNVHDFSSLQKLPLISEMRSQGPYLVDRVLQICRARGYEPNKIIPCSNYRSLVVFLNAGMGFTILPHSMAASTCMDDLEAFFIPGDDAINQRAVGWSSTLCDTTPLLFRDYLKEYLASLPRV